MDYFQGFLIPVPTDKKKEYLRVAEESAPFFAKYGALRTVENWTSDVPKGEVTDMWRGVKASDNESVVFSWVEWESKNTCDKAHDGMTRDEAMNEMPEMPFDGMRMIYAGFDVLGQSGESGKPGYVQGYVAPVPKANRDAYADMCATMRQIALDCGAQRLVDGWSEDIADGEQTDFKKAVQAKDDEAIAFGFAEWPSQEAFETGSQKMMQDGRMPQPGSNMPMDGQRIIYGGFETILVHE